MGFANDLKSREYYLDKSDSALHVYRSFLIVDDLVMLGNAIDSLSGGGITSLNGLNAAIQTFAIGTAGTDFNISSLGSVHTFNIPTASAINRGLLSSSDWNTFNSKGNGTVTNFIFTNGSGFVGNLTLSTTTPTLSLSVSTTQNFGLKTGASGSLANSLYQDNGTETSIGVAPIAGTRFTIQSAGSTNATYAERINNLAGDAIAHFRSDRRIAFGTSGFFANTAFTFEANSVPFGLYMSGYAGAGLLSVSSTSSAVGFYTTQSGKFGVGYQAEMTGEDQKGVSLILSGTGTDGSGLYIENNTGTYDSITVTDGGRRFRINENSLIIYEDGNQAADYVLVSDANGLGRWQALSSIATGYVPYTGATGAVALGNNSLTSRSVTIGSANNTIVMGSTAGVASTISSTSNATKGTITIGAIASIDEANLRFRIGTPTTNDTNADSLFSASATNKTILALQGKLGQADSWLEFQDSTGGILGAFNSAGNFAIGGIGSATDALSINKTFTADTGLFNNAIGVNVISNQTSGIAILTALNLLATQTSGAATLPVCTTLVMGAVAASAGTFLSGFFVGAQFGMTSTVAQTGGIADAYVFNLISPVYSGSKPGVNFGINLQNQGHAGVTYSSAINIQAQSGSTSNYAIVSASGNLHGFGTTAPTEVVDVTGNLQLNTAGNGIKIKAGSNARIGSSTMVAGTVVVANTSVTANTVVTMAPIGTGVAQANAGSLSYSLNAGVGFTIYSTSVLDTRVVKWVLFESV